MLSSLIKSLKNTSMLMKVQETLRRYNILFKKLPQKFQNVIQ